MAVSEIANRARGRYAPKSCEVCKFLSDQQAKINQIGDVVAVCLSGTSIHAGKYRKEGDSCHNFARGPSIDLPDVKRSA